MTQIGTIRINTETTGSVDVPIFDPDYVKYPVWRVYTPSGVGCVNVVDPASADCPYLRVQTASGVKAVSLASLNNANFAVTNYSAPTTVDMDTSFTTSATINNLGGAKDTQTVRYLFGGVERSSSQVTLQDDTQVVTFGYTPTTEGNFENRVSTDNDTAFSTVTVVKPYVFKDDFESGTLSAEWDTSGLTGEGTYRITSDPARVRTGTYALELYQGDDSWTGGDENAKLRYLTPSAGAYYAEVYMFDDGDDGWVMNCAGTTSGGLLGIGYQAGSYYQYRHGGSFVNTSIPRSAGNWVKLAFDGDGTNVDFLINDQVVYTGNLGGITEFGIGNYWLANEWQAFDDFLVEER